MKIIKNAVGKNVFAKISDTVLDWQFPWYYGPTAYNFENKNSLYNYSYSNLSLSDGTPHNSIGEILALTLYNVCDGIEWDIQKILRIRIGSIPVTPKTIIHTPHIDLEFPHKTALLYLNDSDGNTNFYNLKYDTSAMIQSHDYYLKNKKKMKIEKSITPEKNKLVIFDGIQYHSSSSPTTVDRRIVVNYNFIVK